MPTPGHYSLAEIHQRTRIAESRLRYAVDQKLLPDLRSQCPIGSCGRGTARRFTDLEAFALACAVLLLEAGLRRQTVKDCMDCLCGSRPHGNQRARSSLQEVFDDPAVVELQIGDACLIRLGHREGCQGASTLGGWTRITKNVGRLSGHVPSVIVSIHVAPLREALRRGDCHPARHS
jgi:hypothetical protein